MSSLHYQYQNSQHSRVMNLKYKSKYKKLKRQIKQLVFENAALCDEVAQIQSDLLTARDERKYLIKRLMRHEGYESTEKTPVEGSTPQASTTQKPTNNMPKKRGPKKRVIQVNSNIEDVEKLKLICEDKFDVDAQGKPKLPINLYNILVHSMGEILPANPNFHNAHWIYPVGYVATRIYAHPKDPQRKCVYTCKILNNTGMPQFQIIPDNDLDSVFFGETANICHQTLLETLKRSLSDGTKLPLHVQGEKFFGLANNTVQSLIKLDGTFKQCANFRGFPSKNDSNDYNIPEEKDPTMSYEALQSLITMTAYHTMPEIKDEPPDELFELN
ncbi:transforming growth factor beta regulator 1 [Lucilia cuprina]|uniref:transforming growth factor beta regulator 1 n=1 Tax=Lucilia cuprina TaxID=7375 RepID=UPI001F05ED5E|nr:transforming growth factor beta regulator 1 [Lucilia cuprina]